MLAIVLLVVLSPLLFAIALWIRLADPGPALYAGTRVGQGGRPFRMMKFRTMAVDAERRGPSSTSAADPRITKPGRVLRRYKLDELPQLINVLRGEMSFVGPRPQVQWAVERYTPEEAIVLTLRPGITDYASIRFRNEGEILRHSADPDADYLKLIAPLKLRLGSYYVRTYSFLTDLKLITATALAALGVNPEWCLPEVEQDVES